jgi:hypothetical protein
MLIFFGFFRNGISGPYKLDPAPGIQKEFSDKYGKKNQPDSQ